MDNEFYLTTEILVKLPERYAETVRTMSEYFIDVLSDLENLFGRLNTCELRYNDRVNQFTKQVSEDGDVRAFIELSIFNNPAHLLYCFSHEACHYAIDRPLEEISMGLSSIEEFTCELFATYELYKASNKALRDGDHYIARVMESTLSRQSTQCDHQFYEQLKSNGIRDYLPFRIDGSVQYYLRLRGVAVFLLPLVADNPNLLKFLPRTREIQSKTDIQHALDYLQKTADDSYRDSLQEMIKILFP